MYDVFHGMQVSCKAGTSASERSRCFGGLASLEVGLTESSAVRNFGPEEGSASLEVGFAETSAIGDYGPREVSTSLEVCFTESLAVRDFDHGRFGLAQSRLHRDFGCRNFGPQEDSPLLEVSFAETSSVEDSGPWEVSASLKVGLQSWPGSGCTFSPSA